MKSTEKLIKQISIGWLNVFIFLKMTGYAANFARIYTNVYGSFAAHVLIVLFALSFFLLFRNLSLLALSFEKDKDNFATVAKVSVFLLFALLIFQVVPEILLTASYGNS